LGWVREIVPACPDLSSSFAFFAGGLGIVVVAASSRGLVEVCASATGNISGVVSRWHLFPYLTFFADFSSFPFLGWCLSVRSFHRWRHASNGATAITFIMNTASVLRRPGPLMRARVHHALSCWTGPTWAFFITISCFVNVITLCIHNNTFMIFCLCINIVPHPHCLARAFIMHHLYHVVAPGLPITWLLSHLTDFCREIGSRDRNQKVKRSRLALFSCHVHQIWGWNDIFDNVYFENTLFGPFTLKYTFYKNCRFSLSGTVRAG
jgi:hypothetical protein